nr:collagen binding domain-containing protein [Oenococcus oeni]
MTWTVVANYNQRTLTDATISDQIVGDQDYVSDSAKLYEATINSNGTYTLGHKFLPRILLSIVTRTL